jgi:predicted DNA-binding protein
MGVRNTVSMSFSAKPQLFNQVDSLCKVRGCTRSWFLNKAVENFILECVEDQEDYETAAAAWAEFEKGDKKTYSLDEVRKELGL